MNNKGIGDNGAKLVGNELKKNTDCLSLWLFGNGITAVGAAELAKGLKHNKTLTVLDLHDNKLGNEGAKVLAQVLKTNTTLKILNLCSNGIGPRLPMALEKHPTLDCLCFEVVTAPPLVPHDPWTTSHTQMESKKSKVKDMLFEWNKGAPPQRAPWTRTNTPTHVRAQHAQIARAWRRLHRLPPPAPTADVAPPVAGSLYGITGLSRLQAPWERSSAPTLYPGLKRIETGCVADPPVPGPAAAHARALRVTSLSRLRRLDAPRLGWRQCC